MTSIMRVRFYNLEGEETSIMRVRFYNLEGSPPCMMKDDNCNEEMLVLPRPLEVGVGPGKGGEKCSTS